MKNRFEHELNIIKNFVKELDEYLEDDQIAAREKAEAALLENRLDTTAIMRDMKLELDETRIKANRLEIEKERLTKILNAFKEERVNLRNIDYQEQTITLGSDDNPTWTLALGHIDAKEFNRRMINEGWDGFDLESGEFLLKTKGLLSEDGFTWEFDKKSKNHGNAQPITLSRW